MTRLGCLGKSTSGNDSLKFSRRKKRAPYSTPPHQGLGLGSETEHFWPCFMEADFEFRKPLACAWETSTFPEAMTMAPLAFFKSAVKVTRNGWCLTAAWRGNV